MSLPSPLVPKKVQTYLVWRHSDVISDVMSKTRKSPKIMVFRYFFKQKLHFLAMMCVKVCLHMFLLQINHSLNSRDLFLNLRRLVKMTKPLRFENKSLRLKYKCLICIWIIFWAILDLFINPKYLFQNKSFSQTYYFKSEKSFVILTSLLGLKINPGNLESK